MSYTDFLREDRRLVLLRILADLPAYRSNSSVLATAAHQLGHVASRDQIRADLHWLAEQGLLTAEDHEAVLVVTLSERGADVAAGRAIVPGVRRPGA